MSVHNTYHVCSITGKFFGGWNQWLWGLWWASSIMSWSDCQVWGFLALDSSQKSPGNQGLMEHEGLDLPFFEWHSTPGKLSCGDKIWISFRFPNCEVSWNKISCKDRLVYNMLAICQDQIFMKICSYKSDLLLVIIDHVSNFEKHLLRYVYQEVSLCNGKATDRVVRWPTSKFYWLLSVSLICSNLFGFKLGHGCPLQIFGNEISIK